MFGFKKMKEEIRAMGERIAKVEEAVAKMMIADEEREAVADAATIMKEYLYGPDKGKKEGSKA